MAAHAYSVLDSYIYGFAVTKMNLPFETASTASARWPSRCCGHSPLTSTLYVVEFLQEHVMKPGYDYGDEFEYGS